MKRFGGIAFLKALVLGLTVGVCLFWISLHVQTLFGTQHGTIRFSLTMLFALLILWRSKPKRLTSHPKCIPLLLSAALLGVLCLVSGLVVPMRQLEWIGILLLVFACLTWSLPSSFARDIPLALLVLYWANPLPNPWFGALQIGMQKVSVEGSEWLLHMLNVRVWADGLVLRTGVHVFEVPAWCSGMRTATTVFILALALGMLRRLRPHEIVAFIVWSLFHALALNVLRICTMVALAPHMSDASGLQFLHDTAGWIVILGVVVVYFEMLYLERRHKRLAQRRRELNPEQMEALSEYPPFWHALNQNWGKVFLMLALIVLIGGLGYRSRPYHRAMMLKDVAITLRDRGEFTKALQLAGHVSAMIPENINWRFTTIRLNLISGRYEQVLNDLDAFEELSASYLIQKRILKAYALMSLGRIDDAAAIVERLPEDIRTQDPRVAMILAEMALRGDEVEQVATHVVTASEWAPNVGRIRNLYPYLRIHRQWDAMARSDIEMPYHDPTRAFSILEAYMNLNRVPKVADITLQAMACWPHDLRVLEPLFFMAIKRGSQEWEQRFAVQLRRSIRTSDQFTPLYETFYKCFALARPDLAWAIHKRMQQLDPGHPALPMSMAKYGHQWLAFRKRRLGIPAGRVDETLDLKPFIIIGQQLPWWHSVIEQIPHTDALLISDTVPVRKRFLKKAITRFEAYADAGRLTLDMQYLYVQALEMSGRIDLAERQLARIVSQHPEQAEAARILRSEMYARKGDWIRVYETLRTYLQPRDGKAMTAEDIKTIPLTWPPDEMAYAAAEVIHLKPLLRLIKAQLELHLGLAALHTARETVRHYPYSARAFEHLAMAHNRLGHHEAALAILGQSRLRDIRELDILEAEALYETQRYNELVTFCRQALLPKPRIPPGVVQRMSLPPAELALLWHRGAIPSETQFADTANRMRQNLATASPGLRTLLQLWLDAYAQRCTGALADPQRWIAAGRDAVERATALNQLTLLLCREARFAEAEVAARHAVAALPDMPLLWTILISLSGAEPEIVAQARNACPGAASLWLAALVVNTKPAAKDAETAPRRTPEQRRAWVHAAVTEALDAEWPAAVLTRAGEYLWRNDMRDEACRIARHLTDHARGLLPAYVLAIRCALHAQDEAWALRCTERAIAASLQPRPIFYRNLVSLKVSDGEIDTDPDMVNALRNLRKSDPDNPLWPQMLGYIRFQRGGWEIIDALFEMTVAIEGGATNRTPYLIASEVSRLLQNFDRATDILRQGLAHNPDNPALLNNLAYTLSQDEKRLAEAVALIPQLKPFAEEDPRIRDTLAVIYLQAGQLEAAQVTVRKMLHDADPASSLWFRASMHLAEIAWKQGKSQEARRQLETLLKSSKGIPDEDLLAANALLAEIMGAETRDYVPPMRAFLHEDLP